MGQFTGCLSFWLPLFVVAFYINQRRHDAFFDYEVLCSAIETQLRVER